jgi:hypothetical protein
MFSNDRARRQTNSLGEMLWGPLQMGAGPDERWSFSAIQQIECVRQGARLALEVLAAEHAATKAPADGEASAMTEAQLELLRDKFVLWDRASREGNMELREYNRRCAEALKCLLAEHSEFGRSAS